MPQRSPLPPTLGGQPFAVAAAVALGVTRDRLRSGDLHRPFHEVRTARAPETVEERCAALAVRLRPGNAFSHVTAATLWRVPLPLGVEAADLHVVAPAPHRAPEGRGVVGHRAPLHPDDITSIRGLPVVTPPTLWCQLAEVLEVHDLVAAADWLLTGNPYEKTLPMASLEELAAAVERQQRVKGLPKLRASLPFARAGSLSRPESLLRVLCARAGLPEPRLNENCTDARGSFLALADLSWPAFAVAVEYEGDHHRGKDQFRRDIHRQERLVDHGWLVLRVSADDLFLRPAETLTRIASRLRDRGWRGPLRLRHVGQFGR